MLVAAALLTPAAAATTPRPLLPNLVALPTSALFVGTPDDAYVTSSGEVVHGCDPSDVVATGAARCLRFDTVVANFGSGPLEIHTNTAEAAGGRSVTQRLYYSDGSWADRAAGSYELDPAHAHFHYSDFAVAALWRSDAAGHRLGRTPLRLGHKAGFCLEDVQHRGGDVAAAFRWPYACYPTRTPDGAVAQVQGISVGWADVYDISIPHQYVEISGVPDGYYLLATSVDPYHRLRQTTTRDDTVWQRFRLRGDSAVLVR